MGRPSVSIIVVNYNGAAFLGACLSAALQQAESVGAEVVLVDNGSLDGSVELVESRFPEVVLVALASNLGFAGGCNVGAQTAKGELVVILNNDAVPRPGWLEGLLKAVEPEDVAVACSVIHEARYPEAYALGTGSLSLVGHPIINVSTDLEHPFYATGCSLIYKRSLVGPPFESFFFCYFEDTVLSWRMRIAGWKVARSLTSVVDHLGSATAQRMPLVARYYYERNKLIAALVCYQRHTLVKLVPLYCLDGGARLAEDVWQVLRRPGQWLDRAGDLARQRREGARALWWILANSGEVRKMRSSIQRARVAPDEQLVRQLSGKVFDDYVKTWGHQAANWMSLVYCRLARLLTADLGGGTRSS